MVGKMTERNHTKKQAKSNYCGIYDSVVRSRRFLQYKIYSFGSFSAKKYKGS